MTSEDGIVRAVARWAWRMNFRRSRECQPLVFARACHGVGSCTTFRAGTQIEHAGDVLLTNRRKNVSRYRLFVRLRTNFVTFTFVSDVALFWS